MRVYANWIFNSILSIGFLQFCTFFSPFPRVARGSRCLLFVAHPSIDHDMALVASDADDAVGGITSSVCFHRFI